MGDRSDARDGHERSRATTPPGAGAASGRQRPRRRRGAARLLALGHSMKQAAYELGITPRTVAYHKYGAMHVLGIGSSAELVRFAVSPGMLESLELAG